MRLLFITQKVDKNDDVLGVYHRWIEKLAGRVDRILVICLYKGRVELPDNVSVFSLGKEGGRSRAKYIKNFYKYLRQLMGQYDSVFVHMNPEYVLLGGLYWRLVGKKIVLWYNHPMANIKAKIAFALANTILYTSSQAASSKYSKAAQMPVGIDFDFMKNAGEEKDWRSILFLGRISPIKNIDKLISATYIMKKRGSKKFHITIVGDPSLGKKTETEYYNKIKEKTKELDLENEITFKSAIPYIETPKEYSRHGVFVNLTPSGSFDKTIIEAMACEIPVIYSNDSIDFMLPADMVTILKYKEDGPEGLAKKIEGIIDRGDTQGLGKKLRELAKKNHSLDLLMNKLIKIL